MRQMSFSATTPQFVARTKTVTRRLGWTFLKPGDLVMAVEKGQGLKKGEHVTRLGVIQIVSVRRERLEEMTDDEVVKEGFPRLGRNGFIKLFCTIHRPCRPDWWVTRVEFAYVEAVRAALGRE